MITDPDRASGPSSSDKSEDSEYNIVAPGSPAPSSFNDSDGDVILRTSDMKDIQVSMAILKFASPVFKTIFSLPQPPSESSAALAIIQVSESSTTICLLLRLIYPVERYDLASEATDVSAILDILHAARKYELSFLLGPIQEAFTRRMEASQEATMIGFALASHQQLHLETRLAAKTCLRWPLEQIRDVVVPELELISAMDHVTLLKYHWRVGQVAADLFTNRDFLLGPCSIAGKRRCCNRVGYGCCNEVETPQGMIIVHPWWNDWSKPLIAALRNAPLGAEANSLSYLSPVLLKDGGCYECEKERFGDWITGRNAMIDAIKNEVNKIEFKLGWM